MSPANQNSSLLTSSPRHTSLEPPNDVLSQTKAFGNPHRQIDGHDDELLRVPSFGPPAVPFLTKQSLRRQTPDRDQSAMRPPFWQRLDPTWSLVVALLFALCGITFPILAETRRRVASPFPCWAAMMSTAPSSASSRPWWVGRLAMSIPATWACCPGRSSQSINLPRP